MRVASAGEESVWFKICLKSLVEGTTWETALKLPDDPGTRDSVVSWE